MKLIDCHVHLAAFSEGTNGCYISPKMLRSPLSRFVQWKYGLDSDDPAGANHKYLEQLRHELRASEYVGKAIVLAMDGVYDTNGMLDMQETEFMVGNDYVLNVAKTHPDEFLPGVSINPQRRDALEELDRCIQAGASLVKVLPNAQAFDPADRRYVPFYRSLAQAGIPLLSHVGYEFSLIGKDQSLGDVNRLRLPLDEGVTVIAAHGCSNGLIFYEKYYHALLQFAAGYRNFFTDLSSLTVPTRMGMLLRLRRHPELQSRLIFGTDYPLPVFHLPCWGRVPFATLRQIILTTNRFDRQYLILKALGIGFRSFDQLFVTIPLSS